MAVTCSNDEVGAPLSPFLGPCTVPAIPAGGGHNEGECVRALPVRTSSSDRSIRPVGGWPSGSSRPTRRATHRLLGGQGLLSSSLCRGDAVAEQRRGPRPEQRAGGRAQGTARG